MLWQILICASLITSAHDTPALTCTTPNQTYSDYSLCRHSAQQVYETAIQAGATRASARCIRVK